MRHLINLIESAQAGRLVENAGLIGPVFHGSKRPIVGGFEKRKGTRTAFFTTHEVMANGFFFALDRHDAEGYGPYVGSYMLRVQRPLLGGELTLSPKQTADLQYMLEALFKPNDEGWLIFNGIENDYHLQADPEQRAPDWHHEFIHAEPVHQGGSLLAGRLGLDWEVLDHKACVDRMHERGYDGTLTYEAAHRTKISWFVLNAAQITAIPNTAHDE